MQENLKALFGSYVFYFPQLSQFSNFNINRSRFSFESLKILIIRCGGIIAHSLNQLNSKPNRKTLLRVKCNPKFNREETDCKLATFASDPNKDSDVVSNSNFEEALVDFHWITDSVYVQELLPISLYSIE